MSCRPFALVPAIFVLAAVSGAAQERRMVIVDQDCRGPATTDLLSTLLMIQAPDVDVLGITVVSGDQWRDEEVAHTLRLLEIIGRTDIPVIPGAVFPLLNSKEEIARWEKLYGVVPYKGAWNERSELIKRDYTGPFLVPELAEGRPTTRPASEDAAHFLTRMVRQYPHQVTIYAGGPLTNLALAAAIDHEFATLARELVVMGGSINPNTAGTRFGDGMAAAPRREFNFWWDPEATRMVLRARWPKVTVTPVDISIKTLFSRALVAEIAKSPTPAAQYVAKYTGSQYGEEFMWDELAVAAWLDPTIITTQQQLYMDMNVDHGPGYGDTLTWPPGQQPGLGEQLVTVHADLDKEKFYRMASRLFSAETPKAQAK